MLRTHTRSTGARLHRQTRIACVLHWIRLENHVPNTERQYVGIRCEQVKWDVRGLVGARVRKRGTSDNTHTHIYAIIE